MNFSRFSKSALIALKNNVSFRPVTDLAINLTRSTEIPNQQGNHQFKRLGDLLSQKDKDIIKKNAEEAKEMRDNFSAY